MQVELYLVEPVELNLGQRGFTIELRQELQHFGEQRIICLFDRHSLRNHRPDQLYNLVIRDRFVLCDDPLAQLLEEGIVQIGVISQKGHLGKLAIE